MKVTAAVTHEQGKLSIETVELDAPKASEVLVKIVAAGVCHTDSAGINQIMQLLNARGWTQVAYGYYVMPALILIAGLVVLLNPFAAATVPFIILGVSSIVYGITDIINGIRFSKKEDKTTVNGVIIEDVTPVEELPNEMKP